MRSRIKNHDTFFQWRKKRWLAPILLEVIKEIEELDDSRKVYQVRWLILGSSEAHTSVFPMMATEGSFYGFVPIPREIYLQAKKILKEAPSYHSARRRILNLIKKTLEM